MNKFSKFTQILELDGKHFLFNIANEKIIVLVPDLVDIVLQNKEHIDSIQDIHPDLFNRMVELGMIVPQDKDEAQELIDSWEKADNDPETFGIIINPTLDCNLRCWYCYEKHKEASRMDSQTLHAVYELIKDKVCNQQVKHLNVSFFGGEPLIAYKDVVYPILKFSSDLCHEHNVAISSNFTTNGVLLTSQIIEELNDLNLTVPITFQITLDGNRYFHDKTRISPQKEPTYDTIIRHIHSAIIHKNSVYLRFNYTDTNIHSFVDVMDDFEHLSNEERKYIRFNFQQVWQNRSTKKQTKNDAVKIANLFKKNGFIAEYDTLHCRYLCYADRSNHIVVNYNGDIFKCTARDFLSEEREGILNINGTITWNDRFYKRMAIKYQNSACIHCGILPLCNGGCSQNKIETTNTNHCYKGIKSKEKIKIVTERLCEIISNNNTSCSK